MFKNEKKKCWRFYMAIREIEFRGKRVDNGEWVYGLFARCKVGNLILPCIQRERENDSGDYIEAIIVNGETVGQYTGLKDRNGNKIFEGDIIRFIKENCLVIFVENDCAFRIEVDGRISTALRKAHSKDYEVIGNIHDEED